MRVPGIVACTLALAATASAAPSIDCIKATNLAEKAICEDWRLRWSDRQLSRLYSLARKQTSEARRSALIDSQRGFLAERDRCGYAPKCIWMLYHARLKEVSLLVNVHDAYATFARGQTGNLRIARFGYTGAVEIIASGANDHECQFDADDLTQTGKGVLRFRFKGEQDDEACVMNIVPVGDHMQVEIEGYTCRSSCGHRAHIDGLYTRAP